MIKLNFYIIVWGLGIGDWGLGIGDWAQSPIPNPHWISHYFTFILSFIYLIIPLYLFYYYNFK
jgi:hypothetical protein